MYIVEGNIGAGKSTFLELLQKHCPDITVFQEPQASWSSQAYGQSLLENFYKDAHRWAYTIETLAMVTRMKEHIAAQNLQNPSCVMERSIYSGHYCFAQNGYAAGFLSPLEWDVYSRLVEFLVHEHCKPPRGFVYLRATPEVCFERIQKRSRKGEENISLDYLQQIDHWHEAFLISKENVAKNLVSVPVLIVDANCNFLTDEACLFDCLNQVKKFMQATSQQTSPFAQVTVM